MRVVTRLTENQSPRIHGNQAVRLVIAHTPEGGYEETVDYCRRTSGRRVSYHTIVNETGTERTQLVPWHRKAWHAGAYNSLSDGVAAAGFAARFNVRSPQAKAFSLLIASRLHHRDLPARWASNGGGRGFCRHADIQSDRRDPMSLPKWLVFVPMVKTDRKRLERAVKKATAAPPGSVPLADDWAFGRWYLGLDEFADHGPRNRRHRPSGYPRRVPTEGWRAVRWYLNRLSR